MSASRSHAVSLPVCGCDALGAAIETAEVRPPSSAIVAIDMPAVARVRLTGARIEGALMRRQGEGKQSLARTATIPPCAGPVVIYAELQVPPVRLIRGVAGIALQREVKAPAFPGMVFGSPSHPSPGP